MEEQYDNDLNNSLSLSLLETIQLMKIQIKDLEERNFMLERQIKALSTDHGKRLLILEQRLNALVQHDKGKEKVREEKQTQQGTKRKSTQQEVIAENDDDEDAFAPPPSSCSSSHRRVTKKEHTHEKKGGRNGEDVLDFGEVEDLIAAENFREVILYIPFFFFIYTTNS